MSTKTYLGKGISLSDKYNSSKSALGRQPRMLECRFLMDRQQRKSTLTLLSYQLAASAQPRFCEHPICLQKITCGLMLFSLLAEYQKDSRMLNEPPMAWFIKKDNYILPPTLICYPYWFHKPWKDVCHARQGWHDD